SYRLLAPTPQTDAQFGEGVALGGSNLLIGEPTVVAPGRAYVFVDEAPREPLLDLAYRYYATSGASGSGIFRLYDDDTFATDSGARGSWTYQPTQQRFLLHFATGQFCDAFFLGRVQTITVRGVYRCQDGSEVGGLWFGTLSLPLAELPSLPLGDPALQAPPELLRELERAP
ncbi:MAG: hypothetical protein ACRDIB_03660, partial [Ardenticatenaceae bacterium]